jgi:hypothetical protein
VVVYQPTNSKKIAFDTYSQETLAISFLAHDHGYELGQ